MASEPSELAGTEGNSDLKSRATLQFAKFEREHFLQYIGYGDIRGVAIIAGVASAMTLYFTQKSLPNAECAYYEWHHILEIGWFVLGVAALLATGIALCPLLARCSLPGRCSGDKHTSVTHYLDVSALANSDAYIAKVEMVRTDNDDGLIVEQLRECFELAKILRGKMAWLSLSFLAAGASILILLVDLWVSSSCGHIS